MLKQAVIIAGGMGTRLGDKTKNTPKPMLEVGDYPFLYYLVDKLRSNGFERVLITIGYLSTVIKDYFADGSRFGLDIQYIEEETPCGTAGALLVGKDLLDDEFLLINGDTVFDVNYWDLYSSYLKYNVDAAIALRRVEDASRYGSVTLEGDLVSSFAEKMGSGEGLISGGVYIFKKGVVELLTKIPSSIEKDILPKLVAQSQLIGMCYDDFFLDIGLPETLSEAGHLIPEWWCKPIAFLDKDGVLNINSGYVATAERHEWVTDAVAAVRLLNDSGYRVVIITNQAGIGRGYYTEEQFEEYMEWMSEEMRVSGAHFDEYRYCPHHPEEACADYLQECNCRKPEPGMIQDVLNTRCTDAKKCFLIGDKESDMLAARAAGIRGFKFNESDNLKRFVNNVLNEIEHSR